MSERERYAITLKIESISLPPVQDILILGRDCPHGPDGISRCFHLLSPDDFEVIRLDDEHIQAILVNRRILKRMPIDHILTLLRQKAFPLMESDEVLRVDVSVSVIFDAIDVVRQIPAQAHPDKSTAQA